MKTALCFRRCLNLRHRRHLRRLTLDLDLILLSLRNLILLIHSTGEEEEEVSDCHQLAIGLVPGHPLAMLLYHHLLFQEQDPDHLVVLALCHQSL